MGSAENAMLAARALALLVLAVVVVGCAGTGRYPPHPTWEGAVCGREVYAVATPWNPVLERAAARIADVAAPDLGPVFSFVVAVDGNARAIASVCRYGPSIVVLVHVAALERARGDETAIAMLVAHEFAHVALEHEGRSTPAIELEADMRAALYATRAGYDCTGRGVNAAAAQLARDPESYRAAVAAACARTRTGR